MFNPQPKPDPKPKKKHSKLKPRSKKRAKQEREYSKKRLEYLKEHPICEFKGCNKEAPDIHHTKGRLGSLLTDETNFIALCREHHIFIELNPRYAKENNYSKSRFF